MAKEARLAITEGTTEAPFITRFLAHLAWVLRVTRDQGCVWYAVCREVPDKGSNYATARCARISQECGYVRWCRLGPHNPLLLSVQTCDPGEHQGRHSALVLRPFPFAVSIETQKLRYERTRVQSPLPPAP